MIGENLYNNKNYFSTVSKQIAELDKYTDQIDQLSIDLHKGNQNNHKVLVAGNGGSCADAEHFVGELVCTFSDRSRGALSAFNLSSNNAAITAWANDFNFESFIARQVEALGKKGDMLILISTGGGDESSRSSMNLVLACKKAKELGINTFSLIGKSGGVLKNISDDYILINSNQTSVIQECHMSILHAICNNLDALMK